MCLYGALPSMAPSPPATVDYVLLASLCDGSSIYLVDQVYF